MLAGELRLNIVNKFIIIKSIKKNNYFAAWQKRFSFVAKEGHLRSPEAYEGRRSLPKNGTESVRRPACGAMGLPWRDGRSSGARWFRVRRIFGCVPVCGAGMHKTVRVFVGGNGAAGLRGLRIVCGPVGGRTGRRRSAGPGCGGVGKRAVRQRLWGSPFRYPISERLGGFVGFRTGADRLCGGNRRRVRFRFWLRGRALPIFLSAHAFAAACRVKETGCLHRQAPRCHKEVAVGYLRMAATPGSSMPSMYSSSAPPPVDT